MSLNLLISARRATATDALVYLAAIVEAARVTYSQIGSNPEGLFDISFSVQSADPAQQQENALARGFASGGLGGSNTLKQALEVSQAAAPQQDEDPAENEGAAASEAGEAGEASSATAQSPNDLIRGATGQPRQNLQPVAVLSPNQRLNTPQETEPEAEDPAASASDTEAPASDGEAPEAANAPTEAQQ